MALKIAAERPLRHGHIPGREGLDMGLRGTSRKHIDVRLGEEDKPAGQLMASTLAVAVPVPEHRCRRLVRAVSSRIVPRQWLRVSRHDRQRVETDDSTYQARLFRAASRCCSPSPGVVAEAPAEQTIRKTLKGGAHLCAPEY